MARAIFSEDPGAGVFDGLQDANLVADRAGEFLLAKAGFLARGFEFFAGGEAPSVIALGYAR